MGKSRKTVKRKVAVEHLEARLAAAGWIVSLLLALLAWHGIGLTTGEWRFSSFSFSSCVWLSLRGWPRSWC